MDNQTKDDWVAQHATGLGTGIFLVADPDADDALEEPSKQLVADLSYEECVKRGRVAIAFKWVPNAIASYAKLSRHACGVRNCVDRCVDDACVCNRATGRCH